jgi:hypothetical protein
VAVDLSPRFALLVSRARHRPSWQGVAIFAALALVVGLGVAMSVALAHTKGGVSQATVTLLTVLMTFVATMAAVASVVVSYLAWRHPNG